MAGVTRHTLRSSVRRASIDFSRMRQQFKGKPRNYLSYGVVGHLDNNPGYVRLAGGRALVEVTLLPSGDEVIAQLSDLLAGEGAQTYFPLQLGMRVVVGFPHGDGDDPVILGRCGDDTWPFPTEVAGLAIGPDAPGFALTRTPDGAAWALQTGEGGDILVRSGASVRVEVGEAEQILLRGETHIGSSVDFSSAPTGARVTAAGQIQAGAEGGEYVPAPNTNEVLPPALDTYPEGEEPPLPLPADGVVRLKDALQSNAALDPDFWEFVAFIWSVCVAAAVIVGIPIPPSLASGPPTKLESKPRTASRNTIGDT